MLDKKQLVILKQGNSEKHVSINNYSSKEIITHSILFSQAAWTKNYIEVFSNILNSTPVSGVSEDLFILNPIVVPCYHFLGNPRICNYLCQEHTVLKVMHASPDETVK